MIDEVLEKGGFEGFLIGLVEGEVSMVLLGWLTAIEAHTYARVLCACPGRVFRCWPS